MIRRYHALKAMCRKPLLIGLTLILVGGGCSGSVPSLSSLVSPEPPPPTSQAPATVGLMSIKGTVALSHISGPNQAAIDRIAAKLNQQADAHGWALLNFVEPSADRKIQGYMAASRVRDQLEVTYVWDVFDAQGYKVDRVSGVNRHKVASGQADAWDAVSDEALTTISNQVMAAVVAPRAATPAVVAQPMRK